MSESTVDVPTSVPETDALLDSSQLLPQYENTLVGEMLLEHNFDIAGERPTVPATLLILTCMDFRISLRICERSAFIVRTAGAALNPVLPNIAFAVGAAGVKEIAVIGHTDCAMCRVGEAGPAMVDALVTNYQWSAADASAALESLRSDFALDDAEQATIGRANELRARFPGCLVAPLLYDVADDRLTQLDG